MRVKDERESAREHLRVILQHILSGWKNLRPLTDQLSHLNFVLRANLDDWDYFKSFIQSLV